MTDHLTEPEYQLLWPRHLFTQEARRLLADTSLTRWGNRCLTLLRDAFVHDHDNFDVSAPIADYHEAAAQQQKLKSFTDPYKSPVTKMTAGGISRSRPKTMQERFLKNLADNAHHLREDPPLRPPLWSKRKAGASGQEVVALSVDSFFAEYMDLVSDLNRLGYFDKTFGVDCVERPRTTEPTQYLTKITGVSVVWPLSFTQVGPDRDLLFDIVEALHDAVARPRNIEYHDFNDCGWHGEHFDTATGRAVYRWRVNKLLERTSLKLRLGDTDSEEGRLVTTSDKVREEVVDSLLSDTSAPSADRIHHAIREFRRRGATREDKRNALAELAGVLEQRKTDGNLKNVIDDPDADALFHIANKFDIRHHNKTQKGDYPDYYLDWILWTFLASIELTNRIYATEAQV